MKLQLNDVVKSYGADVVLDRVNIQIKDNEKIALVGRNGCGKTTLLKIICEKEPMDSGSRFVANGTKIGYLSQITFLDETKTVYEELLDAFKEVRSLEKQLLENKIIIVDFHAEATAEKLCFARYAASLGVNAVIGTHTHVPTADEIILDDKCAYITDVGFCGSKNGIIGMEYSGSLRRLITSINERFEVEMSYPYILNALEIDFCQNIPKSIRRISFEYTQHEEKESED